MEQETKYTPSDTGVKPKMLLGPLSPGVNPDASSKKNFLGWRASQYGNVNFFYEDRMVVSRYNSGSFRIKYDPSSFDTVYRTYLGKNVEEFVKHAGL